MEKGSTALTAMPLFITPNDRSSPVCLKSFEQVKFFPFGDLLFLRPGQE